MEGQEQIPTGDFIASFCFNIPHFFWIKEAEKASNFVLSPSSFHCMLSLIAVGSRGSPLDYLLSFLGLKSIDELNSMASQAVPCVLSPSNRREDQTRCPIVIRQWCFGGSTFSFEAFLSEGGEMYWLCHSPFWW
jgi:hypothetical protein